VALEGLDGAGTTTQCALVAAALRQRGLSVHETAEPTNGPIGQVVRRVLGGTLPFQPAVLALLFAADRLDHLQREVWPALATHAVVLSDRYLLSSLAYQSIDLDPPWVATINQFAPPADLTIYLAVPPEECLARLGRRQRPTEHYEQRDRLRAVHRAYQRAIEASRLAGAQVVVVDGTQPPVHVCQVVTELVLASWNRRARANEQQCL
jgi:dTMP kinase